MKIVGIFFVVFVYVQAIEQNEVYEKWVEFQAKYKKSYRSAREASHRLSVFENNLKKIESHNKLFDHGLVTFTKGVNQFADMTTAEFLKYVTGANGGKIKFSNNVNDFKELERIPSAIDWREKGAVTPVKDQGSCGSGYAFSATGAIEGQMGIHETLTSLSEQNIVDCSGMYGNMGCNGGTVDGSLQYIKDHGGFTEATYPYTGIVGQCVNSSGMFLVDGFVSSSGETNLVGHVAYYGPTSVTFDVTDELQLYSAGIFSDTTCSKDEANHALLVVGYVHEDDRYHIVKNSWGTDWGESGYFRLKMFENMCGVANNVILPVLY